MSKSMSQVEFRFQLNKLLEASGLSEEEIAFEFGYKIGQFSLVRDLRDILVPAVERTKQP